MKDSRNTILADNIRAERNRKKYSQALLAEKINVSESTISLIERGKQTPSIFVVCDIASALNIDIKDLTQLDACAQICRYMDGVANEEDKEE